MPGHPLDNRIEGRVALVTGASGGMGAAIARKLASRGVHLALHYNSNKAAMDGLVAELRSAQTLEGQALKLSVHQGDLAKTEDCLRICEEAKGEHGQVDILIANAGYGKRIQNVWEIPIEEFDHTLNINLKASFVLVKGVVEGMRDRRWGRIVTISSIAGYGAGLNGCHYAASKGGLIGMMKNLASRLAPYNISVNDVAPAMTGSTGMIPDASHVPGVAESIPLGRLGDPSETANAVAMFCETGFATGQSLIIGGGLR